MKLIDLIPPNDGRSGITIIKLHELTGSPYNELKKEINTLYIQKKIIVREGLNAKLIYKV